MLIRDMSNKFIEWLKSNDYSENTVNHYRFSLNRMLEYYNEFGKTEYDPTVTEQFIKTSHNEFEVGKLHVSTFRMRRKCAALFDGYFETGKFVWNVLQTWEKPTFRLNPYYDEIIKEFKNYWHNRDNWGKDMFTTQVRIVKQFLEYLQITSVANINEVNAKVITGYLNYAKLRHPNSLNEVCAGIRYLGDFFKGVGIDAPDLRLIVPVTPTKRAIMPSFSDDEVSRILSSVDRTISVGKRDYAMLMLMAKLGLRAGDVANLKLTDIDWNKPNTELRFTQHKTDGEIILPIENDVGNAIAEYILTVRPHTESKFMFIRMRSPYRELDSSSIATCTQRYMRKADIEKERGQGSHSFRRHFATKMLNAGIPYPQLCEVMGHRQPHTLKSYVRIDSNGLSECSLPFSEICAVSGVLR